MRPAAVLLLCVLVQRLGELGLARRNTRALLAAGAVEHGAGHYPLVIALHAAWLASLFGAGLQQPLNPVWLALFLGLQGARGWVLASLGRRWTTRIIVLPHARLIDHGPYRFLVHPNYLIVAGEIAALPLTLGLPVLATVFSILNAGVLAIRIRAENAALAGERRAR